MPARVKNAWTRILKTQRGKIQKVLKKNTNSKLKHKDVVYNSRDLWFLALDCWVDDVDKGAAAATDHLEYIYDT